MWKNLHCRENSSIEIVDGKCHNTWISLLPLGAFEPPHQIFDLNFFRQRYHMVLRIVSTCRGKNSILKYLVHRHNRININLALLLGGPQAWISTVGLRLQS